MLAKMSGKNVNRGQVAHGLGRGLRMVSDEGDE